MTRGVDGGLRPAAEDAAFPIEEIDAGWDEAPTSVIVPVKVSRQVSVTPTPSAWLVFAKTEAVVTASDDPTLVLRDDPTLVVRTEPTFVDDEPTLSVLDDEPTLTLDDEPTFIPHDEPTLVLHDEPTREYPADYVDEDSIVVLEEATRETSTLDIPNFRRRPRGHTARIALIGGVALAVAGAGRYFTTHAEGPAPAPIPARVQRAAAPTVAPPAPLPAAPVEAATEQDVSSVTVIINVVPKRATVFRGRERLGSGLVAVNVERNVKQRLTAVLAGYEKASFTVDGTRDTVTLYLSRVAAPEVRTAPASESPAEAPSGAPPQAALPNGPPSGSASE